MPPPSYSTWVITPSLERRQDIIHSQFDKKLKKTLDKMDLINYIIYRNKRGITMTQAIKISKKSLTNFKTKNVVDMATDFVKDSIHMNKVKGAIKECLEKHPELLNGDFTDVVVARILAQTVLYIMFGNEHKVLWKDTATRKQMKAMRNCSWDMHYLCKEHEV